MDAERALDKRRSFFQGLDSENRILHNLHRHSWISKLEERRASKQGLLNFMVAGAITACHAATEQDLSPRVH
jgi:hypothetical protein